VWIGNGVWNMLYVGGGAGSQYQGYASCPIGSNPLVPGNWTKHSTATPVIGNGQSGQAGQAQHAGVYVEDSTVYCYFTDTVTGNMKVATAAVTAPTVWTTVGTVLTPPGGTLPPLANPFVMKLGAGSYMMFYEVRDSASAYRWQIGRATTTTPTGTWTSVQFPVTGLDAINPGACTYSNPWIVAEDDLYVMWFHGSYGQFGISGVLPTEGYRATSTDLATWTLRDNKRPFIRLSHPYEVEQIADLTVIHDPASGIPYAFWSAIDNGAAHGHIMCSRVNPTLMQWDGTTWVPYHTGPDSKGRHWLGRSTLTSDFTTTTAAGTPATITGLLFSTVRLPYNARITVLVNVKAKTAEAGSLKVQVAISPTPPLGQALATTEWDDCPADTYRPFTVPLTFDVQAGETYTITPRVVNGQTAGTLTTVQGTGSAAQLTIDSRPIT
jgi:hypothetical protein